LHRNIANLAQHAISLVNGHSDSVKSVNSLTGGSITQVYKITCSGSVFVLKVHDVHDFPKMLEYEYDSLKHLQATKAVAVPEVFHHGVWHQYQYILMEYIQPETKSSEFYIKLAEQLANMHTITADYFGLHYHNYIGSLAQYNYPKSNGIEFIIHSRFLPQLKLADQQNLLPVALQKKFDHLFVKLPQLMPEEHASLIHGDLWHGNILTGPQGHARLIDPAIAYSYRYFDLGMIGLFGGVDSDFYQIYHEVYPMCAEWKQVIEICNLYPLLVHLNLFGAYYLKDIAEIIDQFC
jgi:fructosamine-3-kinase